MSEINNNLQIQATLLNLKAELDGKPKHRFINTSFGEVKLVGGFNYSTQEHFCEVYIGDNYDDYIGDIDCNILDDEENILQQIEEKLYY